MTKVATSYDVDLDGNVVRVDTKQWERFALDNGAPAIADPGSILGRPFADLMAGPARELFRLMLAAAQRGRFQACTYKFRCDAPHRDREMEMHIEPLLDAETVVGLRFTSIVLREHDRLGSALLMKRAGQFQRAPLLKMCSYCKNVEHDVDGWISPREYEHRGFSTAVEITHGVCPNCDEAYIQPIIKNLSA